MLFKGKDRINVLVKLDGKSAILCTDPSLSTEEIVNMYLEKDFVEKVFRAKKTQEEIVPIRQRLERCMRAYFFVTVTAYRLIAALIYFQRESGYGEQWETMQKLLDSLSRVERMEITLGKEHRIYRARSATGSRSGHEMDTAKQIISACRKWEGHLFLQNTDGTIAKTNNSLK